MPFLLLIAAGVLFWLWKSGRLKSLSGKDWIALALAVLGTRFVMTGQLPPGGAMLSGAAMWAVYRWLAVRGSSKDKQKPEALSDTAERVSVAEARRFLGVDESSDRADIMLAHKRLIRKFHPDNGGDVDLARQANIARDVLLKEIDRLKS